MSPAPSDPGRHPPPPGRRRLGPYARRVLAGEKVAWCACGRSATYPMCDGSHRGTDQVPVKVRYEQTRLVSFCACGLTQTPPHCDGSHGDGSLDTDDDADA